MGPAENGPGRPFLCSQISRRAPGGDEKHCRPRFMFINLRKILKEAAACGTVTEIILYYFGANL